ncbi:NERD domain-containing protein [Halomonas koreensis]|uniref:NERD domain-containing protein n=1 Tax=Halomonas koreensis TaxID=245385 RepID=A0ABU1G3E9_9GAMM|nr:NERD domain-containing protein [Halomonas koreensis]MDR5867475.1 NERD domain-containing protein [Halomonas koreensis]
MILKEKDAYAGTDERGFYGHKQEQDVAFHLRREFGDNDQVRVIHDLVIEHEGERAQIDHLVIHPYGFIIIESKSIVGEVRVNAEGEWSRSYRGQWSGIKSPIRQAELQKTLLYRLIRDNVEQLLGKLLGVQGKVGGRDWQILCAVSSTAILHRDRMPKDVSHRVIKTEFVAGKVRDLVGGMTMAFLKAKPKFSPTELDNLGRFLLAHTERVAARQEGHVSPAGGVAEAPPETRSPQRDPTMHDADAAPPTLPLAGHPTRQHVTGDHLLTCKRCGEAERLTGMYGQYGYYIKCQQCGTNTSMKQDACPECGEKSVRINKAGPRYTATCRSCKHHYLVYFQGG